MEEQFGKNNGGVAEVQGQFGNVNGNEVQGQFGNVGEVGGIQGQFGNNGGIEGVQSQFGNNSGFGGINIQNQNSNETDGTKFNLPVKVNTWTKIKNFLFQEVHLELTPYQKKVLGEVHDFWFQEISFGKKK